MTKKFRLFLADLALQIGASGTKIVLCVKQRRFATVSTRIYPLLRTGSPPNLLIHHPRSFESFRSPQSPSNIERRKQLYGVGRNQSGSLVQTSAGRNQQISPHQTTRMQPNRNRQVATSLTPAPGRLGHSLPTPYVLNSSFNTPQPSFGRFATPQVRRTPRNRRSIAKRPS